MYVETFMTPVATAYVKKYTLITANTTMIGKLYTTQESKQADDSPGDWRKLS